MPCGLPSPAAEAYSFRVRACESTTFLRHALITSRRRAADSSDCGLEDCGLLINQQSEFRRSAIRKLMTARLSSDTFGGSRNPQKKERETWLLRSLRRSRRRRAAARSPRRRAARRSRRRSTPRRAALRSPLARAERRRAALKKAGTKRTAARRAERRRAGRRRAAGRR